MSATSGHDWLALWQRWARDAAAPWSGGPGLPDEAGDPAAAALAAFEQFAAAVRTALGESTASATAAQRLARLVEELAARHGAGANAWCAVPFAVAGGWPDAATGRAMEAALNTLGAWSEQWLALPALGPQREWQAAGKRLARALLAQQRAHERLAGHSAQAARAALRAFAAYLRDEQGPPVDSVRALYDAWIECAERTWHETLMSEPCSRDFGAWVNACSETRLAWDALQERWAGACGLPARAGFDDLVLRHAALKTELAELRAQLARVTARGAPAAAPEASAPEASAPEASAPEASAEPRRAAAPRPARKPARPRTRSPRSAKAARKPAADERRAAAPGAEFDIARILDGGN